MEMGAPLEIAIGVVGVAMVAAWLVLAWLRNRAVSAPQPVVVDTQVLIPATEGTDGWMEVWGISDDRGWYEHALELTAGAYRLERTSESVERTDFRGETRSFSIERLFDDLTSNVWSIGSREVSNGVYAVIYKPYTDQKEATSS
jgi:hypothetical protein